MGQKTPARYRGENHRGSANSAPYPLSRMAPATELVDLAREIALADTMLGNVSHAKLRVIAEQMRHLQREAHAILASTARDQRLHRAQCNFQRRPGTVYHLYRRDNGRDYFSMLAPGEWGGSAPHEFVGSYRLENDMSWTPVGEDREDSAAMALLDVMMHTGEQEA